MICNTLSGRVLAFDACTTIAFLILVIYDVYQPTMYFVRLSKAADALMACSE